MGIIILAKFLSVGFCDDTLIEDFKSDAIAPLASMLRLPSSNFNDLIFSKSSLLYFNVPNIISSDILFFNWRLGSVSHAFLRGLRYCGENFLVNVSRLFSLT